MPEQSWCACYWDTKKLRVVMRVRIQKLYRPEVCIEVYRSMSEIVDAATVPDQNMEALCRDGSMSSLLQHRKGLCAALV